MEQEIVVRKAQRSARRLRLALTSLSKGGKTLSALLFARALVGPSGTIGVVDSEGGNCEIYQGEEGVGDFLVVRISECSPANYIAAMRALHEAGCGAQVIDSLSHAWMGRGGVLQIVDATEATNRFTGGWKVGTPEHQSLIEAINTAPFHVIATMRQKAEYVMETKEKNGKTQVVPRKVGMKPEQRDGMEYEFDITADMEIVDPPQPKKHVAMKITGTRGLGLAKLRSTTVYDPDASFIDTIRSSLDTSAIAPPTPPPAPPAPRQAAPSSNGTHPPAGGKKPQVEQPETTKQRLWGALSTWSGVGRTNLTDLLPAGRRVYKRLGIDAEGKATEAELVIILKYIQRMQMEKIDFAAWCGEQDEKRLPPTDSSMFQDLDEMLGQAIAEDLRLLKGPKSRPQEHTFEPIAEEDIPF